LITISVKIRDVRQEDREEWKEIAERTKEMMNDPELGFDDDGNLKPLPKVNRGSWFCPCVTLEEAIKLHELCRENDVTKIYDLGAGDFRLSVLFDRLGYDVVAFETLEELIIGFIAEYPDSDIDLRAEDYHEAFPEIVDENSCYACFGRTNKLPTIPEKGLAVQGYEKSGVNVLLDGKPEGQLMDISVKNE